MSADSATARAAMPPAKTPRRSGVVATLGILLAILLTVLGVLAVRDALLYAKVLGGSPVLHDLAQVLQGLRPQAWVVVIAVVLTLLGLVLLVTALRPSVSAATAVTAETGVFLRPRDVNRLVETAAEGVDGVLGVRVSSTPRRLKVDIRSTGDEGVEERVRDAVTAGLAPLEHQPTVRVRAERARR